MSRASFLYQLVGATFFRDKITKEFEDIDGYLLPDEGYALFLAAMYGPGAGAIVEIGSFKGRSTCFLAAGAKRGNREKVVAIDHFVGSPEHQRGAKDEVKEIAEAGTTYPQFQQNLARAGLTDQVEPIYATTDIAAQAWNRQIRLIFIDGDHSYEATKRDFDLFSSYIVPDGVACFHDVGRCPGVTQFCEELSANGWRELFRSTLLPPS